MTDLALRHEARAAELNPGPLAGHLLGRPSRGTGATVCTGTVSGEVLLGHGLSHRGKTYGPPDGNEITETLTLYKSATGRCAGWTGG
jgi:hypothetical protein